MTKETKNIYQAMLAVQQGAPFIDKAANNPFFKSKYADLPIIWKTIKDLMGENKLLVMHLTEVSDAGEWLRTKLVHADTGECVESVCKLTLTKHTAQEYGSYITYMRRYSLSAMLGLVTDEDDDANSATQAQKNAPPKKEEKPKPTPEQQRVIDRIEFIKGEMVKALQPEDVTAIMHKYLDEINKFTQAQQDHVNNFAVKQRALKG
jgi:hypothetical protein